jgi:hypothetical protein
MYCVKQRSLAQCQENAFNFTFIIEIIESIVKKGNLLMVSLKKHADPAIVACTS